MDPSFIPYTAGLLDGEGSIQINPSKGGSARYWCLTVCISNNHREVMDRLHEEWNMGNVTSWTAKKARNRNISYNWRVYGREAERFLSSVFPYLIIKQERAKIALEFRKLIGSGVTLEISSKKRELALKIRTINQRNGRQVPPDRIFVRC